MLTADDRGAIFNLIQKVQPGFYEPDSRLLGKYYGIWQEGILVACAGERMRLDKMTEISGICTDPEYTGCKYAQHLVTHLCNTNIKLGNLPFLHLLQTNERAIGLYEYPGFRERRLITFWQLTKTF